MITDTLKKELEENGYSEIIEIAGRGTCGVQRMIFTVGLVYGMDEYSFKGRYCFHTAKEAREALAKWDGIGDPDGNWIKHKGRVEYPNPNYSIND